MAYVQIIGGNFQDANGNVVANGTITFVLNQDAAIISLLSPLTLSGQLAAAIPVTFSLDDSGNVPNSLSAHLWSNDEMEPSGTYYTITVYDADGARVWGPLDASIPNTSPYNLDVLIPASASGGSSSSFPNVLAAKGDMIYSAVGSTPARLPIGSTNQILMVGSGLPLWTTFTLDKVGAATANATLSFGSYTFSVSSTSGQINLTSDTGGILLSAPANLVDIIALSVGIFVPSTGQIDILTSGVAHSGTNFNSPRVVIAGGYWDGSVQNNQWSIQTITGSGSTPTNILTFTSGATGSLGATAVSMPTIVESVTLSPTSGATAGITGQIAWDSGKIYVCTSGGAAGAATWKAADLTTV